MLISGSQFQTAVDPSPSPNTPIVFDLTGLPASQRHGYGWAVGGVLGNGTTRFLSFSELRAYGYTGVTNTAGFQQQPQDLTVTQGQRGTFVERATNSMGAVFNYQWQKNGVDIPGATDVNYSIPPAALGDDGATFDVTLSRALTSRSATLHVVPRTTAPNVVAANLDAFNFFIEVWFDEPVDGNTAQNAGNYTLNDPGMSVYFAVTNANGYCVTLSYSGAPTVPNLTVTASGIQDLFGHTLGSQATAVLPENWPVTTVVANAYQQPRATCLDDSTNGAIVHATGDANIWQTFEGTKNPNTSDFVGLVYPEAQVFGVIKVDLGYQFGDGGDWELQPLVYILKNPVDTNQRYPESDPSDWVQVPANLMSGNVFNYGLDGPVGAPTNTPIAFDLSHLPLSQRTGYGWAVGGVPANQAAHFLSITELRGFGAAATAYTVAGAPQVMLDLPASLSQPAGLPLTLTVYATGTQPISYQWKRNGIDVTDSAMISGSHSSVLTLAEAFASDAGTYQLAMTNTDGSASSTACAVSLTRIQPNNSTVWTQNGNNGSSTSVPMVSGNTVTLTDGLGNEDASMFLNYPQYIGGFVASFTYQDVGGGGADGAAFVLQNDPRGPTALGAGGGGLGYGGITPSAALEFNLYGPNAPSATSSGINFQINGAVGVPYVDSTPVNPAGGNPIDVIVRYDGTTLSLTLTDTVALVSFSTNYVADLPTLLGTNTAYVGITGANGGVASTQRISNFYFAPVPVIAFTNMSPGVLQLSWPASAGGLALQSAADLLSGSWTTVSNAVTLVNGRNQVQVSPLSGTKFYRLGLP